MLQENKNTICPQCNFQSIVNTMPQALFILDVNRCFLWCNQSFLGLFNRDNHELIGKPVTHYIADYSEAACDISVEVHGQGLRYFHLQTQETSYDPWGSCLVCTVSDITQYKALQRYQDNMFHFSQMLLRINHAITESDTIEGLLDMMMQEIHSAFLQEDCGCILVNQSGVLKMVASIGYTKEAKESFAVKLEDSYYWRYSGGNHDKVYRINQIDLIREEDYTQVAASESGVPMISSLSAPIVIDGAIFGLINFDAPIRDGFTQEQEDFMEYVRGQLAIAIKNMRLYEHTVFLSRYDRLTGLVNRHYFESVVEVRIAEAVGKGTLCHLISADADGLKIINDVHGHLAGDEALIAIGLALKEACGQEALVCRFGGDEFLALVLNVSRDVVGERLEGVRQKLFTAQGYDFSYGIATHGADLSTYKGLLRASDEAMYRHKRGRTGLAP